MTENKVISLIQDESKLDIPKYIDRPELVKHRGECLSLIALGGIAWVWLLLPGVTLLFWWFKGTIIYQQMIVQSGPRSGISLINIIIGISIFVSLLILWAIYNWIRYYQYQKEELFSEVTSQQLASSFKVKIDDLLILQQSKYLILHYSEEGDFDFYEVPPL